MESNCKIRKKTLLFQIYLYFSNLNFITSNRKINSLESQSKKISYFVCLYISLCICVYLSAFLCLLSKTSSLYAQLYVFVLLCIFLCLSLCVSLLSVIYTHTHILLDVFFLALLLKRSSRLVSCFRVILEVGCSQNLNFTGLLLFAAV